ncbi:MAG: hypothetical protein ACJAYU_000886 [Bradymonadia bacterium]|jgi:hypothetical protein
MTKRHVRITHGPSRTVLADGPLGWGVTPFEGNFYIQSRYLVTSGFRANYMPGLCVYKFLYVWMDLELSPGERVRFLGWKYVLPNPLFPFIWFRVGLPKVHPELVIEYDDRPVLVP